MTTNMNDDERMFDLFRIVATIQSMKKHIYLCVYVYTHITFFFYSYRERIICVQRTGERFRRSRRRCYVYL